MINGNYAFLLILVSLAGCVSQPAPTPTTATIPPTSPATFIQAATIPPITIIPSPLPPTPTAYPYMTPDPIQLERWREYERALAQEFRPRYAPEETFCEWEILGRSDQEVYVLAACGAVNSQSMTIHATVIHLRQDGTVERAEAPGYGSANAPDIRRMFTEYLHQRIFDLGFDSSR